MAIYTLSYINEMKTKEEYSRSSFKKKYNYKPSKEDKDIGTIEVDGSKYKVDMRNRKYTDEYYKHKNHNKTVNKRLKKDNFTPSEEDNNIGTITLRDGQKMIVDKSKSLIPIDKNNYIRSTHSEIDSKDGDIILDRRFFKKKGSNHNERRDATLYHEIGHHKTLNKYYINDKNKDNIDKALEYGKKYEKKGSMHAIPEEFAADRYAASKTSNRAMKKTVRNTYKQIRKELSSNKVNTYKPNKKKSISKDMNEKDISTKYNKDSAIDYTHRSKALNDKKLKSFRIED
jgi:hypothetical protein